MGRVFHTCMVDPRQDVRCGRWESTHQLLETEGPRESKKALVPVGVYGCELGKGEWGRRVRVWRSGLGSYTRFPRQLATQTSSLPRGRRQTEALEGPL